MKKCLNCKSDVRDTDRYCRNCGCPIEEDKNYVFTNVLIIFVIIGLIGMIALFIASYLVS